MSGNQNLSGSDIPILEGLDKTDVERTLAGVRRFLRNSRWVGKSNFYAGGVSGKLRISQPDTPAKKRNLAQFIASSAALHASDGWSYLGRSISTLLCGDAHRSLHLAYYAELRAALSILASAGIGVFDKKHYVISDVNSTRKLTTGQGTHVTAWLALKHWAGRPGSGNLFASIVRPEGLTLEQWFHSHGGASALAPQAQSWLMQWGMDLEFSINDREARNESSYRPDGIPDTWMCQPAEVLDFVEDMWNLLEPGAGSEFANLDLHILRLASGKAYRGQSGKTANAASQGYQRFVEGLLRPHGFTDSTRNRLRDFLLRNSVPNDPIVFLQAQRIPKHSQSDVYAVLARAVFLLRIASGSTQQLFSKAGIEASELEFWKTEVGVSRGLWAPNSEPTHLTDLWADVEDSIGEVRTLAASAADALDSFHGLAINLPGAMKVFSSHERVGLWSMNV